MIVDWKRLLIAHPIPNVEGSHVARGDRDARKPETELQASSPQRHAALARQCVRPDQVLDVLISELGDFAQSSGDSGVLFADGVHADGAGLAGREATCLGDACIGAVDG